MKVIVNGIVVKKINMVKDGVTTPLKAGYCGSTKVFSAGGIPEFTYSGKYSIAENNGDNWKIKFLTSGTLKITSLNGAESGIDVFLVGGGGGGMWSTENEKWGGGGGYTKTSRKVSVKENTSYPIIIGAGGAETKDGGASSAFGFSASGGKSCHSNMFRVGGAGGSGGSGIVVIRNAR